MIGERGKLILRSFRNAILVVQVQGNTLLAIYLRSCTTTECLLTKLLRVKRTTTGKFCSGKKIS